MLNPAMLDALKKVNLVEEERKPEPVDYLKESLGNIKPSSPEDVSRFNLFRPSSAVTKKYYKSTIVAKYDLDSPLESELTISRVKMRSSELFQNLRFNFETDSSNEVFVSGDNAFMSMSKFNELMSKAKQVYGDSISLGYVKMKNHGTHNNITLDVRITNSYFGV